MHRKANLGPLSQALAYRFTFSPGGIAIARIAAATVDEIAESLPLWQRIKESLTHGPRTLAHLAGELGAKVDTVDKAVKRKPHLFTRLTDTPDGVHRIAILERRTA